MSPEVIVVFAGGDPPPASARRMLEPGAYVIAADSGLDHARGWGLEVDLLVGDLDSVSAEGRISARQVEQHPPDKSATDLALALHAALRRRPAATIVVGGAGGRLDHFLANAALLASADYAALALTWVAGRALVHVVRDRVEVGGAPGDLVSIVPYGGPARGVCTTNLRWPLVDATLAPGTSLGVSNELLQPRAAVRVGEGVVLVIQPEVFDE